MQLLYYQLVLQNDVSATDLINHQTYNQVRIHKALSHLHK